MRSCPVVPRSTTWHKRDLGNDSPRLASASILAAELTTNRFGPRQRQTAHCVRSKPNRTKPMAEEISGFIVLAYMPCSVLWSAGPKRGRYHLDLPKGESG